jgi:hypothetical protein
MDIIVLCDRETKAGCLHAKLYYVNTLLFTPIPIISRDSTFEALNSMA